MIRLANVLFGFIQDFAAGCWAASAFAVWWLERQSLIGHLLDEVLGLQKQFFSMGLAALATVVVAGTGRWRTGHTQRNGKQIERSRWLLSANFVFLFSVFACVSWWQYQMIFM